MTTGKPDDISVADDEIAAFVDRILRMKSEEDAIKSDIKEIYAEAKGRGYDKTRLGDTVATVRKLEKDADGEAEKEAIRDLYLTAYYRAKNKPHTHAYARGAKEIGSNASKSGAFRTEAASEEITPEHDAETGEITEPQSVPPAARDLTTSHALNGQVAPHPEAKASEDGGTTAQDIETPADGVTGDASRSDAGRSASATSEIMGVTGGESAASKPMYASPGTVVEEHTPPEPVKRHPISAAFSDIGQDSDALRNAIFTRGGGVAQPIVKIGAEVLDGWARYNIARSLHIDYPVVQYDGTDLLADVIRWNVASRSMSASALRMVATKLCKIEPERADDIMGLMGLTEVAEAAE